MLPSVRGMATRCAANNNNAFKLLLATRAQSTAAPVAAEPAGETPEEGRKRKGLLAKFFAQPNQSTSYSKILTKSKQVTYEMQFEYVKPEAMDTYLEEVTKMNTKLNESDAYPAELMGSWTSMFGDEDLAIHLWIHKTGFDGVWASNEFRKTDPEQAAFQRQKGQWLRSRHSQLLNEFAFWGTPRIRDPSHMYELRSYTLKPGTLIEWGNNWSQAIDIRKNDAVGGWFSNIGPLYQVHYLWAYNNLTHRKKMREKMWTQPGWGDCVANTVPLVQSMQSQLLIPTAGSPMK